jgi:hypothetical protein
MYKILFLGTRLNRANFKTRNNARKYLRSLTGCDCYAPLGFTIQKTQ